MSWLSVPTLVHLYDNTEAFGILVGRGDDSGFYLFKLSLGGSTRYVISDTLAPVYVFGGAELHLASYRYAGKPVWENDFANLFVFWSVTQQAVIIMGELREPVLLPLLEGETEEDRQGDTWWVIPVEEPCPTTVNWNQTIGPSGRTNGVAPVVVACVMNLWEPYKVDGQENEAFCGIYRNDLDGSVKTVGSASFRANSWAPIGYLHEIFVRSGRPDAGGHYEYSGSRGHAIRWNADRQAYCIGAPSGEDGVVWWENPAAPTIPLDGYAAAGSGFSFSAKTIEDGEVVDSQEPDIVLRFNGFTLARERKEILVGEVSAWR